MNKYFLGIFCSLALGLTACGKPDEEALLYDQQDIKNTLSVSEVEEREVSEKEDSSKITKVKGTIQEHEQKNKASYDKKQKEMKKYLEGYNENKQQANKEVKGEEVTPKRTERQSLGKVTSGKAPYFTQIMEAYVAQKDHVNSLPKDKRDTVQDPLQTLRYMVNALSIENPSDEALIRMIGNHIAVWRAWNPDDFELELAAWAQSIDQSYEPLLDFFELKNSKQKQVLNLSRATVEGQPVVWNSFGYEAGDTRGYDYFVFDAYYSTQPKDTYCYLFTFRGDEPVVLVAKTDKDHIEEADFAPTKNAELQHRFSQYVDMIPTIFSPGSPKRR